MNTKAPIFAYSLKFRTSVRRQATAIAMLGLGALGVAGCETGTEYGNVGQSQGAARKSSSVTIHSDRIRYYDCGEVDSVFVEQGALSLLFNQGDAPEHRLWANAKSDAPTCTMTIPVTVPSGKKFTPVTLAVRGAASQSRLTAYYYWKNGEVSERPPSGDALSNAYSFERDLPLTQSDGDVASFNLREPLEKLDSPTCGSQGSQLVTLVVSLRRFVETSNDLLAIDSLELGVGGLEKCSDPGTNPIAKSGETCGWIDNRWTDCRDPQSQRCVTSYIQQIASEVSYVANNWQDGESGKCVDTGANSKDRPTQLVVGEEEDCAGPFMLQCQDDDQKELVCMFRNPHAAQSNDHYTGMCVQRKNENESCNKSLFSVCDQYQCSKEANPCREGLECVSNVCVKGR
jgi:hypothetical protein